MRTLLKTIPLALAALIFVAAPAGATEDPPEAPTTTSTTTTTEAPTTTTTVPVGSPNIFVSFTPDETQPEVCLDPSLVHAALEQVGVGSADDVFSVAFRSYHVSCEPIVVTAAIYAMPGFGEAWPQTLTETVEFTIEAAGTYEVAFNKGVQCSQYDVIAGTETPEVIAPIGEWHGPLLFPLDTATSLQNWDGCPTAPPVTTPEVPTEIDTPATTVPAPPAELAFTGPSRAAVSLMLAAALISLGVALLIGRRLRKLDS